MNHINRNFAWCDEFSEDSFSNKIYEYGEWDDDEYFLLEDAIYAAAKQYKDHNMIPREPAWRLMRIYSNLLKSFSCHYDPDDYFKFKNINAEQYQARRERLQLVFEGF
ncbi:MAG: immunity 41 family protein, partial [Proteobacteria bacterium]|nr:immunity 41 family protein [Pseudomonadota bacterium]